ncbi:hypothetical protein MPDQ_003313 [Monascus purpureus]|uniref:Ams2/SPT21 N-terminal domain-containing protein n=1 Tax=Monascus purpureus TaxID=5098 RepID=A0A507R1R9_MONPU|nr:hypothetical protein MPDQ_003313 [Monascus purpureus]
MRLKVLYTFDDDHKTNCLARWPQLLDIQTAQLDEKTQIGVIELKTCIQAIVSASPELVAKLGRDYTVYAYDYSEYETPLVGQGMLSWVLASASPTPNAPAHQSRTMVTGRVCKNVLGLFSKGAQETLEVKLRLVPVPTVLQAEYLESIQKYRELSNVIPHDFDAQAWTNFIRQNPGLMSYTKPQQASHADSPVDQSGIERVHQILSEGSTPRDLHSMHGNEPFQAASPAPSAFAPPSRLPTPGGHREASEQPQLQQTKLQHDLIRPSSSASMRDAEFRIQTFHAARRDSVQSGYGSAEDSAEPPQRKRAKLYRADHPAREDFNIERQPASLRVAASTAASVRIHRPFPVNPSISTAQQSNEEPIRPPTPISRPSDILRRPRPLRSQLRETSTQSSVSYTSPYPMSDDNPIGDTNLPSPEEESRYQGLFEPSFSMPSSPPFVDRGLPSQSSPVLPTLSMHPDSGFMSGDLEEDILGEDVATPSEECRRVAPNQPARDQQIVRPTVTSSSTASIPATSGIQNRPVPELAVKEVAPPPAPTSTSGSRPCSRAGVRPPPKPLAPAPMSRSEVEQLINSFPASDPIMPPQGALQHSHSYSGPMSDYSTTETPAPQPIEEGKVRSGASTKRQKQVQARLDKAIREGQVPPYCENCGAIETPTWRRAFWKEIAGSEQDANEFVKDRSILFWRALLRDENENVVKFKIYKKSLVDTDKDFVQILLCNPCGIWLHKFKAMRPENRWNKQPPRGKRQRGARKGPLNNAATRSRSNAQSSKPAASSPGQSDASSPAVEDGATPQGDNENNENDDHENDEGTQEPQSKRRRANSVEPRKSTDTVENRWLGQDAIEALQRAIQSSPARNMKSQSVLLTDEKNNENLTPKPVRRALFPTAHNDGKLKVPDDSLKNSPRRSPRIASRESDKPGPQDKENHVPATYDGLDDLFENPEFEFELPSSPTPRRRNVRPGNLLSEKRLSLPCNLPSAGRRRDTAGLDGSPTKLSAQKLQLVTGSSQSSAGPNKGHERACSEIADLPSLPDDSLHEGVFTGGIDDMLMDLFRDGGVDSFYHSDSNWADWIPDYVPPADADGSNNQQANQGVNDYPGDNELLGAILTDSAMQVGGSTQ